MKQISIQTHDALMLTKDEAETSNMQEEAGRIPSAIRLIYPGVSGLRFV